jgi:hypothetical protein
MMASFKTLFVASLINEKRFFLSMLKIFAFCPFLASGLALWGISI